MVRRNRDALSYRFVFAGWRRVGAVVRSQRTIGVAAVIGLCVAAVRPSAALTLASVGPGGAPGNAASSGAATNTDGTIVAFYSDATNLVVNDTNQARDVFVRDLNAGTTERVSVSGAGAQANGASLVAGGAPALSGDGNIVVFYSDASNLVADDTNGLTDVFVRVRGVGATTERASVSSGGDQGNGASTMASISGDGRFVAFQSQASNLVPDDTNNAADIFVRDRQAGTTERVCGGVQGNRYSFSPAISADGNFVAFASAATNLVPDDTNHHVDIFVCNRTTQVIERVSVSSAGAQGNGDSILPAINGDGTVVGFKSLANNLVASDNNNLVDVFVRDRSAGTTERISVNINGGDADDFSFPPSLSLDGRFVAFGSFATNLIQIDTNMTSDVFVRDRKIGRTRLVTRNAAGQQATGGTPDLAPSISGDGQQVAFVSSATNLVNISGQQGPNVFSTLNSFFGPDSCPDSTCPVGLICNPDGFCVVSPPTATPSTIPTATNTPIPTRTPTPTPTFQGCTDDNDCPSGEHCRAGFCKKERGCVTAAGCFDREACVCVNPPACDAKLCECGGDCNVNGIVLVNEITKAILILGGAKEISTCYPADIDGSGTVTGTDITKAVLNQGLGCVQEGRPLLFAHDRGGMVTFTVGSTTSTDGAKATVGVSISGGGGEVATAQIDLLYDPAVLSIGNPGVTCAKDPRLSGQVFSATLPSQPPPPAGLQRVRLFVGDITLPIGAMADGPVFSCTFDVQPGAPAGVSVVGANGLEAGDARGDTFGSQALSGGVSIVVPTATAAPEPTAPPPFCAGDCDGNGAVSGSEVTSVVRVMAGVVPLPECPAADADGDGEVFVTDIARAVLSLGLGCPR